MNRLNNDVEIQILSYLEPYDIIVMYNSSKQFKYMLDELSNHQGFSVNATKNIGNKSIIEWFQQHNIRLNYYIIRSICNFINVTLWYQNGLLHRDGDKPAIIYSNGQTEWYQNGKLSRDGDKPAIICFNGDQMWYQNGKLYRVNNLQSR